MARSLLFRTGAHRVLRAAFFAQLTVTAAAVLLLAGACGGPPGPRGGEGGSERNGGERPPRAVRTVEIAREPLVGTIEAAGVVSGIREASVVSETEGRVTKVSFALGDTVEEGQELVAFDAERERAELRQAEADLELARIELAATESLRERGTASQAELARRRAALSGAEARRSSAKRRFEDRTVRAPISGRVSQTPVDLEVGTYIGRGSQLARIVDTVRLRTEVGIGEREIALIEPGVEAEVRVPACSDVWRPAEVTAVGAGGDLRTGSFPVRIEWDNPCLIRTRAGMSVQARIEPVRVERKLVVPSEAVLRRGGREYLYLYEDGRAVLREIEIIDRHADRVAVAGEVSERDRVIVSALSNLRDGDEVQLGSSDSASDSASD